MLGQVQEHRRQFERVGDQEAFVVGIKGTFLQLTVARFSSEYLKQVELDALPLSERLYVRRSINYSLKTQPGRLEAMRVCLGLLYYLWSGEAEVGLLQDLFRSVRARR